MTSREPVPPHTLELPGLDGNTPLGVLAALGVLRLLDERSRATPAPPPRLSWRWTRRWSPVLHGPWSMDELIDLAQQDAEAWQHAAPLRLRYPKQEKSGVKLVGALKPPVAVVRAWLADALARGDQTALAYSAALMHELAHERLDEAKVVSADRIEAEGLACDRDAPFDESLLPTPFDFTSRNAQFLEQVEVIRASVTPERLAAALRDGASDPTAARTLDWDQGADVPGALFARATSTAHPGAEWLAFRGLVYFPVAGLGGSLRATSCRGRRKRGAFVWPLWEVPATPDAVASLLRYPAIETLTRAERHLLGVVEVFQAAMTVKADGYNGMFAPTRPA